MFRVFWSLLLMLALTPSTSSAIQLRWNSGTANLTFTSATRCTLVVQADLTEGILPAEWRLLWVADSCEISPVPLAPDATCRVNLAEVLSVSDPTDSTEIAANMKTVRFCAAGVDLASTAQWVLDLRAGSKGKLKVVALDPTDPTSTRVLESPVVTFNGGVDGPFPPVILGTKTDHRSTEFSVTVVGGGLAEVRVLSLVAPDGSWRLPLNIANRADRTLTGTASLASHVPACIVEAESDGGVTAASIPPDPPPPQLDPQAGCQQHFVEDVYPPYTIQPKDFAFVAGGWTPSGSWTFHLFYIRKNQLITNQNANEKNLGHAVSNDLNQWTVLDTAAVKVRPGRFDSQHVWAPSIVKRGLTYYMFYTGADNGGNQRIGLATSTDLVNWAQGDSVLEIGQVPWADPNPGPPYAGRDQLRDAFVMEDPAQPGKWIMYFVTIPAQYSPGMVAGFIKSNGDFHQWNPAESSPLWATLRPFTGPTGRVESPHVFMRNGKWWLFHTANHDGVPLPSDTVYAVSNVVSPTDTTTANWTPRQALQNLVPVSESTTYNFWHATEYLEISASNDIRYLAAWNDAQVAISYTQMRPTGAPFLFTGDCPTAVSVDSLGAAIREPRLLLTGQRPARSQVGFRVELPARTRVFLAIYDVRGRQVRNLVDDVLPAGATELSWDGRDMKSALVGSGIYFASVVIEGTRQSVRVSLIR